MEKPTVKQVKEKYKNAKIVNSAYFKEPFDITEYDFSSIEKCSGDIYITHSIDSDRVRSLFDYKEGFAEILTLKE